ncbi:protein-glutamate O-methyltransferase CheR [soil metagenome]
MPLQLTEREHRLFSEWLGEEFGLRFGPEKRDILRSRLEPRRAELGFESFEQLYFHLKFHPLRREELDRLIPHLTNNESYFFREQGQLDVLKGELLRTLRDDLEKHGRRELRILSAACASGEEPYTLAMLARSSGLFTAPWVVNVTGVDLDPQALERARAGRYTENAFRRIDESVRARHFTRAVDGRWEISQDIRNMVTFRRANLVDDNWAATLPKQDVVFCRNVLIYFGEESTRQAVEGLYRALTPGGYLFLGHAESLSRVPTRLEAQRRPGAIFYRRPDRNE